MNEINVQETQDVQAIFKQLPFSFASKHGVFLSLDQQAPILFYKQHGLKADVFAEVRRYVGKSFSVEALPVDEFQKQLSLAYQKSSNEAAQAAEDIGADMDLSRLAEEIPETSDLMSGEDDAPVVDDAVRALMVQAENLTDALCIPAYSVLNDAERKALVDGAKACEAALK